MAISSTSSAAASAGSAFNVDGIVSGLKTADLIAQLMKMSQAPLNQLTAQQTAVQTRDAAYQAISSQMISFQGSVQNLLLSNSVNAKLSASSTPAVATAVANSTAINGTFSVKVDNLATATSATSSGVLGSPADLNPATTVTSANLSIAPTAGNFTINGQTIALTGADTWSTLQSKIATATGGAVALNLGSNSVSLTSTSSIQLGSPTDTSNFLGAAQLLGAAQTGSAGAYTVASNQLLGEAKAGNPLSTAGLSVGGGIAASGSIQINGVSINWVNSDSLNGILTRINSSSAGVTATYDPKQDKVSLTNSNTGAQSISLADSGGGNLLQALHLIGTTQVAGAAAQYETTQNGVTSAPQYSNSNTVIGAVQGVNLTFLTVGTTSISTTQDTTTATTNLQAFVKQFNSMVDLLDADTAYDTTTGKGAVLAGDSAIRGLTSKLRSLVTQAGIVPNGSAYATMGDIGISTGAYGSAVGTTNHLVLDPAKLTAALQTNPQAVSQVLSGLSGTTSAIGDATNPWIQTATGTPYGQVYSGTYRVRFDPTGNTLTSVFTSSNGIIQPAVTGIITAGGTNTTLIPGVSIAAMNPLPGTAGTDTINYTVSGRGILQTLNDYVNQARGPSGIFTSEHHNATTSIASFTAQIANQNQLLARRQTSLQAEFTAMEVALSSLQSQSAALASSLTSLNNSSSNSSSKA
jgi:flagellar hook-associated protein 2